MRGARASIQGATIWNRKGSSPRMRGALNIESNADATGGIIPADAGSTCGITYGMLYLKDHPRGCGEHNLAVGYQPPNRGSSPRMRGARFDQLDGDIIDRIIPADAGSTLHPLQYGLAIKDHPRGCGEHGKTAEYPSTSEGSSPRMRGAPQHSIYVVFERQIIPADAGST